MGTEEPGRVVRGWVHWSWVLVNIDGSYKLRISDQILFLCLWG